MEPGASDRSTLVTQLLRDWQQGDKTALDRVIPLLYDELRRVARRHLRQEAPNHLLQTTALVHEAYLRLADIDGLPLTDRAHLFALAAKLMRQILIDHARRERADKRGGNITILPFDGVAAFSPAPSVDVIALDEALGELNLFDPRMCRVVELRFFGGLNVAETAEALGLSHATIERDWTTARAWLHQRLTS